MEIQILNIIQNLRTDIGDTIVPLITKLGDAGMIWICLTIVLLIIPKTRKTGVIMMAALLVDVLLCNVLIKNLVARTRPFDVNTAVQLSCTCGSDRIIKIVPVCALSNGHHWWCGIRKPFRISGL